MKTQTLPAGKLVFAEGDQGDEAYLIKKGSVEISVQDKGEKRVLATIGEGEIFGEMAMIESRPRSASARVLEEAQVEVIEREHFMASLDERGHELLPFLSTIFERLRLTNERLLKALDRLDELEPTKSHHREVFGTDEDSVTVRIEPNSDEMRKQTALGGIVIRRFPFLMGRRGEVAGVDSLAHSQLLIAEPAPYRVSRKHCFLDMVSGEVIVEDSSSKLGTMVNGERIGGKSRKVRSKLESGENSLILGDPDSQVRFKVFVEAGSAN